MKTYEKTSRIECKIEDLFNFHLDFNNLKMITPKDTKVTMLDEMFIPKEGDILRLKTVKNFIPMKWEVKINTITYPNILVDIAIKSPFKYWKHTHSFTDMGDGFCELKDIVEYELPFGFIGEFFNFFVNHELGKMFLYRHTVTRTFLGDMK